ncbi:MAG: DUF1499 domain-containing protein [Gammaproteobacteria bacterium]|nr:DUF1499 domain-containing protein [Gammaproteobacteria bacterium]
MLIGLMSVLVVLVLLAAGLMFKLGSDSRRMIVSVGVVEGRLMACPSTPNCVSSDAPPADSHYIAPIADPAGAKWSGLVATVQRMPGAALIEQRHDYAYFTFTTGFWRFVDDVEFHHRAQAGEIAIRSASRVGQGDWGANRSRLEAVRAMLE